MGRSNNVHKFVSFSEQIEKVGGDLAKWNNRLAAVTNDQETYLAEALTKWNDLDYGEDYRLFLEEIPIKELQTYAQVLHRKDEVMGVLLQHMEKPGNRSMIALIEITMGMARDLNEEFYDYMWPVFDVLMSVMQVAENNKDLLETAYLGLALLFKLQWRKIIKELRKTFARFVPLFGSRRMYVRRFAAESFAFLLRKSSAVGKLTTYVVSKAAEESGEELADGAAQLFYHMIRGVNGGFHSNTEQLLAEVINSVLSLSDEKERETGLAILEASMVISAEYALGDHMKVVNKVLLNLLEKATSSEHIVCMFRLISASYPRKSAAAGKKDKIKGKVRRKGARSFVYLDTARLYDVLDKKLARPDLALNNEMVTFIVETVTSHMASPEWHMRVRQLVDRAVGGVSAGSGRGPAAVLDLLEGLAAMDAFELYIMPAVAKLATAVVQSGEEAMISRVLSLYATICVQRRPIGDAAHRDKRTTFFDVSPHQCVRAEMLKRLKAAAGKKMVGEEWEETARIVAAWPWMFAQAEGVKEIDAVLSILKTAMSHTPSSSADSQSCLVFICVAALHDVQKEKLKEIGTQTVEQFVKANECDECSLRAFALWVSVRGVSENPEELDRVEQFMAKAYFNPNPAVRANALEVLAAFRVPLEGTMDERGDSMSGGESVYCILRDAERVVLDLSGYRERVMHLRKLQHAHLKQHCPVGRVHQCEKIVLRVCLSQWFESFTPMWPMMHEVLETYARGMELDAFWSVVGEVLEEVNAAVREGKRSELPPALSHLLRELLPELHVHGEVRYSPYRLQLLKFLVKIADLAERRTKVLSPMLLDIYEKDYMRQENSVEEMGQENEEEQEKEEDADKEDEKMEEDGEEEEEEEEEKSGKKGGKRLGVKETVRSLCAYLEIYAKFSSPVSVYLAPKIREMYDELLMAPYEELQTVVLKCLFTYKNKNLNPYKPNFEKLTDEKTFFGEIVMFGVDDDYEVVQEEHRQGLMPVALRFMYGKLLMRVPRKVSHRRSKIFQWLAGCRGEELNAFLRILFQPLLPLLDNDDDYPAVVAECEDDDMLARFPLVKLKSGLLNVSYVLTRLSPKMRDEERQLMLRLLLCSCVLVRALIARKNVDPALGKAYRTVRQLLADRIREYFHAFPSVLPNEAELRVLFDHFVTPWTMIESNEQLARNLAVVPFAVIKMLTAWAALPPFYRLLSVQLSVGEGAERQTTSPIGMLCDQLLAKGVKDDHVVKIREALWHLLTFADEKQLVAKQTGEGGEEEETMEVDQKEEKEEQQATLSGLEFMQIRKLNTVNLGTSLVLSQLDTVLHFLAQSIEGESITKSITGGNIDVLNKLASFVENGELGRRFALVLLSNLEKVNGGGGGVKGKAVGGEQHKFKIKPDTLIQVIGSVARIAKHLENPDEIMARMVKLFSVLHGRPVREQLVVFAQSLAENKNTREEIRKWLRIAADLDSWDGRMINEPDFERRYNAYAKMAEHWATSEPIDIHMVQLFIHQQMYTAATTTDLSLRSSSSSSLRSLLVHMGSAMGEDTGEAVAAGVAEGGRMGVRGGKYEYREMARTVNKHLIPLLIKNLKNKEEAVREEMIRVLITAGEAFPRHSQLQWIGQLRHEDVELDFLHCMVHIQQHRRQRAMHRLSESLLEEGKITAPVDVLLKFVIPIIQPYMMVEGVTANTADQALMVLNAIMRRAEWSKYLPMFDHWMKRLASQDETQKSVVRILVAILDAFHFDITRVEDVQKGEDVAPQPVATKEGPIEIIVPNESLMEIDEETDEERIEREEKERVERQGIRNRVLQNMIPRLKAAVNGNSHQMAHKKAVGVEGKKFYQEDDDIKRAPMALATVKLLLKLPQNIMDQHLHGVVLKLCHLIISRSWSVRDTARKTMIGVCEALGPRYLPFVIKEMEMIMTKGYQIHVMIYSTTVLLAAMAPRLKTGDIDPALEAIMKVACLDLFTSIADEREIGEIREAVAEVRTNRTMELLQMAGRFVGGSAMARLLVPLREVVETKPTAKTVKQAGDALKNLAIGLNANEGIDASVQLIFCYQLLSENIGQMAEKHERAKRGGEEEEDTGRRQQSCLLIPKEPTRIGVIVKTSVKSKVHVFVEFALQLFSSMLHHKKFSPEDAGDCGRLDPFVAILGEALKLKYDKIITFGLRSLERLLSFPLPSWDRARKAMLERMFVLLADYSAMGSAGNTGTVLQLNQLLFKAFTAMVRHGGDGLLQSKHTELLLNYVETDVLDTQKQATAFSLVKTIVGKRIQHKRLPGLIDRFCELVVVSELPHVQTQCRQVVAHFVGNHPQSGPPLKYVEFFLAQLSYEYEAGRLSAAEMLHTLFDQLLPASLEEVCMLAVVRMGPRLVVDEYPKCRKYAAGALRKLLEGVGEGMRNDVFAASGDWLESDKEGSRAVGMEMCLQLSYVEKEKFAERFIKIVALVCPLLAVEKQEQNSEQTRVGLLDSLTLMAANCGDTWRKLAVTDGVVNIIGLLDCHCVCVDSSDVRRAASALIGQWLAVVQPDWLMKTDSVDAEKIGHWMCWQLKDMKLDEKTAQQASKNVVCVAESLTDAQFEKLVFKLAAVCKWEIAKQPDSALKRTTCIKAAAALAVRAGERKARFDWVVHHFMPLLLREMNRKSAQNTEELCSLASEVGEVLKQKMGEAEYGKKLADCQVVAGQKASERKRKQKELFVVNPVAAEEERRMKQERKKKSKRRRMDELKPYRVIQRKQAEARKRMENDDE